MDREELTRRLMVTFLEELEEHTSTLNRGLIAIEQAPDVADPELVTTLFRTAHSLKGAARSVGVIPVEQACHELEEILALVRDGRMRLGSEAYKVLFAAVDSIGDAGRRLRNAEHLPEGALRAVVSKLEAVRGTAGLAESPSAPTSVPPPVTVEPAGSRRLAEAGLVRVSSEKLDGLLAQSGELLATRGRVESRITGLEAIRDAVSSARGDLRAARKPLRSAQGLPPRALVAVDRATDTVIRIERELERFLSQLTGDVRALTQATARLDDEVRRARMVPFAEACEGLVRAVRDLCAARDKQGEVLVIGGELEIDRYIAQRLKDPLLHLVRNAVDHGLESALRRGQTGKPPKGKITVSAVVRGPFVEVSVEDDGAGVDVASVSLRARERGLMEPVHERDVSRLIFMHGFSTARNVTEVSGRGVGLDAVKATIEALHGSVEFFTSPGSGSRFLLRIPLTLTTLRVLVLRVGAQIFAVPTASVARVQAVTRQERVQVQGRPMLRTEAGPIPFVTLGAALDLPEKLAESERVSTVILRSGETAAFAVDELVAEHEVVVKSLGPRLRRVKNVSGAAILPSGRLALILSAGELVRRAALTSLGGSLPLAEAPRKRRILVVDDTVTTRTLVKSILEGAGYEVTTASDGVEAFSLLSARPFDLVVSDVEMPRMDGFALTRTIRGSEAFAEVPVILVTALSSESHRKSGLEAGANAYLVKTAFDQESLLQAIRELV